MTTVVTTVTTGRNVRPIVFRVMVIIVVIVVQVSTVVPMVNIVVVVIFNVTANGASYDVPVRIYRVIRVNVVDVVAKVGNRVLFKVVPVPLNVVVTCRRRFRVALVL